MSRLLANHRLRRSRLTNAIAMTASMIDNSARKMSKDNSGFNEPPKLVNSLRRPSCSDVHTRRMIKGITSKNIMTSRLRAQTISQE